MYVMFTSHMYIIYIYESMILHYVEDRRQKCIRNPRQPAEWFKFQNAFFSQPCRPPYVRRTQQVPAVNWRHVHKPCTMCERRVYMRYIGMYIYNFIHVHTVTVKRSALYPVGYINTLYCTHTHTFRTRRIRDPLVGRGKACIIYSATAVVVGAMFGGTTVASAQNTANIL